MIEGVEVQPLKIIPDTRGDIYHMLRDDSSLFEKFGEIYFSFVNPGQVKGWKKHLRQTQLFAVPLGQLALVIFDGRDGSSTKGNVEKIEIGADNYQLVKIPPQVWYSFKALGEKQVMIANCTDVPHDPKESVTKELSDPYFPYQWDQTDI